jgi:hypothetical protein
VALSAVDFDLWSRKQAVSPHQRIADYQQEIVFLVYFT